jgi:hypothetical protein
MILILACSPAAAESCIAVIGTGFVGSALGPRFASLGHEIVYGSRNPGETRVAELVAITGERARAARPEVAASACDIVVFAVPWEVAETALKGLGPLTGKIVIDVTNPLDVRDGREFAVPVPDSGSERLQAWAPEARFVKAFNTLNHGIMRDPAVAGGPVSVPLSGDDSAAKEIVAGLVRGIGLEPVDVGPLRTARYTEQMALLYVSLLLRGGPVYEFYLRER